eukprot:3784656-Pleurochrysis_carterae.AAC.1
MCIRDRFGTLGRVARELLELGVGVRAEVDEEVLHYGPQVSLVGAVLIAPRVGGVWAAHEGELDHGVEAGTLDKLVLVHRVARADPVELRLGRIARWFARHRRGIPDDRLLVLNHAFEAAEAVLPAGDQEVLANAASVATEDRWVVLPVERLGRANLRAQHFKPSLAHRGIASSKELRATAMQKVVSALDAHLELSTVGILHGAGIERLKGEVGKGLRGLDLGAEERALGVRGVVGEQADALLLRHLAALLRLLVRGVSLLAAELDRGVLAVAARDLHHARLREAALGALGLHALLHEVAADAVGSEAVRLGVGEARRDSLDVGKVLVVGESRVREAAAAGGLLLSLPLVEGEEARDGGVEVAARHCNAARNLKVDVHIAVELHAHEVVSRQTST